MSEFAIPPLNYDLKRQVVLLPGTAKPGYTAAYANAVWPEINLNLTTYDIFNLGRDKNPEAPCLGRRPWITLPAGHPSGKKADFAPYFEWITYAQVEELRTAVGSALTHLSRTGALSVDGQPGSDTQWTTAIWTLNRPEYLVADLANQAYSRITVTLYESLDPEMAAYVLNHSESKVVFTTSNHLPAILDQIDKLPHIRAIVLFDDNGSSPKAPLPPSVLSDSELISAWVETAQKKAAGPLKFFTWAQLLELGRANLAAHIPPASGDVISALCYTSGTTGLPKAAIVAHRQIAHAMLNPNLHMDAPWKVLSYLPVAHIYGRMVEASSYRNGSMIGYSCGDTLRLIEDFQILKPTWMPTVPRIMNRVASLILQQANGPGLKAKLLKHALEVKLKNYDQDGSIHHALYDKLIFKKVAAVLGGEVKHVLTGSAPARPEVLKLWKVCFSADVREGYGLTETTGASLFMWPGDRDLGLVGPPTFGNSVRLKDAAELGYTVNDRPHPRGEIQCKGPNVFPGYYKDEEKTKEALDDEGWFSTGDVGEVDELGRFKIIDRVKNLLKLAQGEYVALERVESTFAACEYLAQIWVYGESTETFIVAVGVPEPGPFAALASKVLGRPISPEDQAALQEAVAHPQVIRAVLQDLTRIGRAGRLNGYELIKGLHLTTEMFSVENGLLTPTFKVKRPEAKKYYAQQIKKMYADGPVTSDSSRL